MITSRALLCTLLTGDERSAIITVKNSGLPIFCLLMAENNRVRENLHKYRKILQLRGVTKFVMIWRAISAKGVTLPCDNVNSKLMTGPEAASSLINVLSSALRC